MIITISIENSVEYNSSFTTMYRSDDLILKYNKPVYDMYQNLLKLDKVYDEFNVGDIYLNVEMINIKK